MFFSSIFSSGRTEKQTLAAMRLRAENLAIASSCCGFTGEATLTESAVIILFAGMLGAGDMLSMLATSVLPLVNGLGIVPMACFAARRGRRGLILSACALASLLYFLASSAPFFGRGAAGVLIGAIFLFSLASTGFISSWFPMLDSFLVPERRAFFFGRMRFRHQLSATVFLFAAGMLIGESPRPLLLQGVMYAGALIYTGRLVCIARIPEFQVRSAEHPGWAAGLAAAVKNAPLAGFSVYQFLLNLSVFGTVPLAVLYMKNILRVPDNVLVFISGTTFCGMMLGYLVSGGVLRRLGGRRSFLFLHAMFLPANFLMPFLTGNGFPTCAVITVLLVLTSFALAAESILQSSEMLALATPGNKTVDMAFCGAFYYTGGGLSRLASSFLLGAGLLAPEWGFSGMKFSHYSTLFFLYAAGSLIAGLCLFLVPAVTSPAGASFRKTPDFPKDA